MSRGKAIKFFGLWRGWGRALGRFGIQGTCSMSMALRLDCVGESDGQIRLRGRLIFKRAAREGGINLHASGDGLSCGMQRFG
jgi:hypothetical protein